MASGNDMDSAKETYSGFTNMVKWGSLLVAVIVVAVVAMIS